MKLGEVYKWNTTKVAGRTSRDKLHVYICSDDEHGHTFLFINSADWLGDYKIAREHYDFLDYDSFVGCSAAICYSTAELAGFSKDPEGILRSEDIKGLRDALIAAESMIQRDLNRVCKALAVGL
jgi:hypothetical protein